jgi:hypothetical protein
LCGGIELQGFLINLLRRGPPKKIKEKKNPTKNPFKKTLKNPIKKIPTKNPIKKTLQKTLLEKP